MCFSLPSRSGRRATAIAPIGDIPIGDASIIILGDRNVNSVDNLPGDDRI